MFLFGSFRSMNFRSIGYLCEHVSFWQTLFECSLPFENSHDIIGIMYMTKPIISQAGALWRQTFEGLHKSECDGMLSCPKRISKDL